MTDHFANAGKPMPTLDLAELLEQNALMPSDDVAAAELRRLHEEIEELKYDRETLRKITNILNAQERFWGGWESIVKQAFARINGDEAIMRKALNALDPPEHFRFGGTSRLKAAAIAALQERLNHTEGS